MNTRLEQFIAAENISKAEFADNIGVARASVSHVLSGRNNPSFDFIMGLMRRYPRLNIEWLLAGKGKMYKDSSVPPNTDSTVGADEAAAKALEAEPDMQDLFSVGEETPPSSPRESDISQPIGQQAADPAATQGETISPTPIQPVDIQRKITKIVIFYDDNTYQELP